MIPLGLKRFKNKCIFYKLINGYKVKLNCNDYSLLLMNGTDQTRIYNEMEWLYCHHSVYQIW